MSGRSFNIISRQIYKKPFSKVSAISTKFKVTGQVHSFLPFSTEKPRDEHQSSNIKLAQLDAQDYDDENDDSTGSEAPGPCGLEYGGPTRGGKFKEPTRFGDWEKNGRCSDF